MRLPAVFALILMMAGCQSSTSPLVLGHIASFTGPEKDAADQEANGIRLALEDYGSGNSRNVAVHHVDGKGDLTTIEGQAVRLAMLNNALALIGGSDAAEASRLDRSGVVVISPIGQKAPGMSDRVIVTGLSPVQRSKALATFLSDKIKPMDVVLWVEPGDESSAIATAFVSAWTEAKHAAPSRKDLGDAASDVVKQWANELPKNTLPIVIGSPTALQTLALNTSLRDRPIAFLGAEVLRQPLKERKAPIFLVTAFALQGKAAEFAKRYEAKFGTPAEPQAALAYDDTKLAIDALKRNPLLLAKLKDDLAAMKEIATLGGPAKFSAGALERPAFVGKLSGGAFEAAQ